MNSIFTAPLSLSLNLSHSCTKMQNWQSKGDGKHIKNIDKKPAKAPPLALIDMILPV